MQNSLDINIYDACFDPAAAKITARANTTVANWNMNYSIQV